MWLWVAAHLHVPDGPHAGRPLVLNADQTAVLFEWYRLDDAGGFVHRRGCWRAAQGTGKSPLLAAIALAELAGPTRFDGWDGKGRPLAVAPVAPWIQIAAVSEDQSGNTYKAARLMAVDSDLADSVLDVGLTRITLTAGAGLLESVTASASTRFGQRVTFAVMDETHLWTRRNGGTRLADVVRRSAAKMGGRTLESTNAFAVGEDSVAEATHRAALEGAEGLLYVAVEAPLVDDLTDTAAVRTALLAAYGEAASERGGWVDLKRLAADIADPATSPDDARRFYFNQLTSGSTAFDIEAWSRLAAPAARVEPDARIALGFDGSISDDETVLYGCTEDGHLFLVGAWSRPPGAPQGWRIPRNEVHTAVADAFARFDVAVMFCDPPKWWTELDQWAGLYGDERVVAVDTNSVRRFAPLCDQFATAVLEGAVSHDGDPGLTHALAACARKNVRLGDDPDDGRSRFVIVKSDTRKIDRAVAAILAFGAAKTMPPPRAEPMIYVWQGPTKTKEEAP